MYIPKRYGESKVDKCPFCNQLAISINSQGVSVCAIHKDAMLGEMRCICGEYLEMRKGKFGVFFNCMRCGPQNMKKILSINRVEDVSGVGKAKVVEKERREITIRSDDPRYFD